MISLPLYTAFALVGLLARFTLADTDAWHVDDIPVLVNERLDPIVDPNSVASHMHSVIGGSAFGASYNFAEYSKASCSSVQLQVDKSNYWIPQLYWYDPDLFGDTPFVPVRGVFRFYYMLGRNSDFEPVQPFPEGLRILAGDPNDKTPGFPVSYECRINANLQNGIISSDFNFDRTCQYGVKSIIEFPQCWDGANLWLPGSAHMAYPPNLSNYKAMPCPVTHPFRIPAIRIETVWYPDEIAPGTNYKGHMVWANGDTTGYGFHGDFVNGWDTATLSKALNSTGCVGMGGEIFAKDCPVLAPFWDSGAANACRPSKGVLTEASGNAIGAPIAKLPGCNALWGTGPKPACDATPTPDVSKFTGTNGALVLPANLQQNKSIPTSPGWADIGCFGSRDAIPNWVSYTDASTLTVDKCLSSCLTSGYNYAGLGSNGNNDPSCICGNSLLQTATVTPGMCTNKCPGNAAQNCGGNLNYEIFFAPASTPVPSKSQYNTGCLFSYLSGGLYDQQTYTFSSASMTQEICAQGCVDRNSTWAALRNKVQCFCGTTYKLGQDLYQDQSFCNYPCPGNSTQKCGGDGNRYSVFNLTLSGLTASTGGRPAGFQGCFVKPTTGNAFSDSTWNSNAMTVAQCVDGCAGQNYTYAGLQNGYTCSCGNTLALGQNLPYSQCNTPCTGNSTQTCGTSANVELYVTSVSKNTPAALSVAKGSEWQGCYMDAGSTRALTSNTYQNSGMSPNLCREACVQFGATFYGTKNGNECSCGSALPASVNRVTDGLCNSKCVGNNTQTCGSPTYMDVYKIGANVTSPSGSSTPGYVGCYNDPGTKGLTASQFNHDQMTVDMCRSGCKDLGFAMAGVQNGNQCNCGNSWTGGNQLPDFSCTSKCGGNSTQICGAPAISSLWNTTGAAALPTRPSTYLGCFWDNKATRLLSGDRVTGSMTINTCRAACALKNYALAGIENGNECYCGNTQNSPTKAAGSLCNVPCESNSTQLCGGSWVIDVYNATGATPTSNGYAGYSGCFSDYGTTFDWAFNSDVLTTEMCTQVCTARGFPYAATYNGNRCQCGSKPSTQLTVASACSANCAGNSTQKCGAGNAVSSYDLSKIADKSGAIDTTSDSTGFLGCFGRPGGNVLPTQYSSNSLTPASCFASCAQIGAKYGGLFFGQYCLCGNSLNATTGGFRVSPSICNKACTGDSTKTCGGSDQLAIYEIAKTGVSAPAAPYEGYKGCYALGNQMSAAPFNYNYAGQTDGLCRRLCRGQGYSVAALSGGRQCSCSGTPLYGSLGSYVQCDLACPANSAHACGGNGNMASIYDTTGAGSLAPSGFPANYYGCFTIADGNSKLTGYTYKSSAMTTTVCKNICSSKGFKVYGTKSDVCQCGSSLPTQMLLDTDCFWNCAGSSEMCGSPQAWSVFNNGLAVGSGSNSSVSVSASSSSASASVSVSASVSASSSVSSSASVSVSVSSSSSVSKSSSAGPTGSSSSAPVSSAPASSSASSSTSSAPAAASSAPPPASASLGCYTLASGVRDYNLGLTNSTGMTQTMCQKWCRCNAYGFAALINSTNCQCGNVMTNLAKVSDSLCSQKCAGNSTQTCGAAAGSLTFNLMNATAVDRGMVPVGNCKSLITPAVTKRRLPGSGMAYRDHLRFKSRYDRD